MIPKWCCPALKDRVHNKDCEIAAAFGDANGPHFFLFIDRKDKNREDKINYCPWCGAKLAAIATQ